MSALRPKSGHQLNALGCPLSANKRHGREADVPLPPALVVIAPSRKAAQVGRPARIS
jgi:hypothetical protein